MVEVVSSIPFTSLGFSRPVLSAVVCVAAVLCHYNCHRCPPSKWWLLRNRGGGLTCSKELAHAFRVGVSCQASLY